MSLPLVMNLDLSHVVFVLIGQFHRNDQFLAADKRLVHIPADRQRPLSVDSNRPIVVDEQ